tara:strand:+ start:1022 stop:1282 length:261 start_codon:yes stop_codon:yes gene_type:complete
VVVIEPALKRRNSANRGWCGQLNTCQCFRVFVAVDDIIPRQNDMCKHWFFGGVNCGVTTRRFWPNVAWYRACYFQVDLLEAIKTTR